MTDPRIIVALDYATMEQALAMARRLTPDLCRLKVGLELFIAAGPGVVDRLIALGYDVFLDLKLHDIPNTVARACEAAARLGVWMLNVHTLGGSRMLRAAREAVDRGERRPLLTGVTILTSHSQQDIADIGLSATPAEHVASLARLARQAGLDGVVCSPREAAALRREFGAGFLLVTPGVRPADTALDDQRRVMTPAEAVAQGADYLVIGRPVTGAGNPGKALERLHAQVTGV